MQKKWAQARLKMYLQNVFTSIAFNIYLKIGFGIK